jgi:hypothetical protein
MKVRPDPAILNFSGKFPRSNLILMSRKNRRITYARYYIKPNVDVSVFTAKIKAIGVTWTNSSYRFKENVYKYATKWNEIYTTENDIPISGYSLFIKACFAMSKLFNFDLSLLSISTFSDLVYGDGSHGEITNTFKDFFLWDIIPVFTDKQLGIYNWFQIHETSIPIYQTLYDIGAQIPNVVHQFWKKDIDNFIFHNYGKMGDTFIDSDLEITFGDLYPLQKVVASYDSVTGSLDFGWSADVGENGGPKDTVYCYFYIKPDMKIALLDGAFTRDSGTGKVIIGIGYTSTDLIFLAFAFTESVVSTSGNIQIAKP